MASRLFARMVVLAIAMVGLAGCTGENGLYHCGQIGTIALYASFNVEGNGYAEGFAPELGSCVQHVGTGVDRGLALNSTGGLDAVGGADSGSLLRAITDVLTRGDTVYDPKSDYQIALTSVIEPQGFLYQPFGSVNALLVIADAVPSVGGPPSQFPALHAGFQQVTPMVDLQLATVNQAQAGGPIWGLAYDLGGDRLFATRTDGVISVFDNFQTKLSAGFTPTMSRTITPGGAGGSGRISLELHGLAYDATSDKLVVADFDAGRLYVFANASTAHDVGFGSSAVVAPERIVEGAETKISRPTDVKFGPGGELYVADQGGSGRILRFDNFLAGTITNPKPDAVGTSAGLPQFLTINSAS